MRRAVLTLALIGAAVLAAVWVQGGFEALARAAAEGQRAAQNAMAGALRSLRAGEAGALAALLGLAFSYGLFHAVGPGHGKVLIGAYGAATRVRLVPLAVIALAASLAQATTAVALVHGGVALFDWTRTQVTDLGEGALTQASTVAIGLIGLWLAWRGARGLAPFLRPPAGASLRPAMATAAGAAAPRVEAADLAPLPAGLHAPALATVEAPAHGHAAARRHTPAQARADDLVAVGALARTHGGAHTHAARAEAGDRHPAPAATCAACGHRHGPSLEEVAGLTGWRDALLLIGAIAIRPCTGALFLLILTWRMGIGAAGILATYVMGLGTALVTVAVAALAVLARDGALDWSGRFAALRPAVPLVQLAAGLLVALIALQALRAGL